MSLRALSNTERPPHRMISLRSPVVSGSCQILSGSVPAMQAAAASAIEPEAPVEIMPDSAPEISARRTPAARCSSPTSMEYCAASSMARRTSGQTVVPPRKVKGMLALMTGLAPRRV